MATLAVQNTTKLGAAVTMNAAAAGGDTFLNDGRTVIIVRNAHAANPRTVTITPAGEVEGVAVDPIALVVVALTQAVLGPFPPRYVNNQFGQAAITYSDSAADVTVGLLRW